MRVYYASTFYKASTLHITALEYLAVLPKDVKGLISMGYSGCSIAAGMLALSKRQLHHVSIRKDGEQGHQCTYAGNMDENLTWAIVDDFISTGETLRRILKVAEVRGWKISCVVVNYNASHAYWKMPIICTEKKGD